MLRLSKYQYLGDIGKGTYGTIEIYKKDQEEVVVKRMIVNDSLSQVIREIEIYKKIQHPHIVSYIDHKYGATSILMLERGRCTLGDFINGGQYSIEMYNNWIFQIISAVDYLHYYNLIHTDLKPANIIMFRGPEQDFIPKICDLGCCQIHMADRAMSCYIQTENYRSPEIKKFIDHKSYHGSYDHKIDIWSLGIIMVDLLCHKYSYGKFNYYTEGHLDRLVAFCQANKFLNFLPECLELIKNCLAHDPVHRWNTRMLLNHPYWEKVNVAIRMDLSGPGATGPAQQASQSELRSSGNNSVVGTQSRPAQRASQSELRSSGPNFSIGAVGAVGSVGFGGAGVNGPNFSVGVAEIKILEPENSGNAENSGNVKTNMSDKLIDQILTVTTPINADLALIKNNSNLYLAKSKDIFRYPLQDRRILDLITNYYHELPELLVIEAYYYSLKLSKRYLKINQWRLIQYCVYILSMLYFDQVPGLLSSIYQFKNRDIFQILNNSHDLILF